MKTNTWRAQSYNQWYTSKMCSKTVIGKCNSQGL